MGEAAFGDEPVVLEAASADDPLGLGGASSSGAALMAQGTYLSRWTGRLVEPEAGLWVFAFDAPEGSEAGEAGPVMVMLPCLRLLEMQRVSRDRVGDLTFRVSGHVTVFEGRNYFLPRLAATVGRPAPAEAALPDVGGESAAPAEIGDDPTIEELIARVRAAAPATEVTLRTNPDEQGESAGTMHEGALIVSRVGRAVRRSEGALEFVVDNGALGEGTRDGSAILLPSLLTQEIGDLVDKRGDRVRFTLSGEVLVYAGRAYVLPSMYRIEPGRSVSGLTPGQ